MASPGEQQHAPTPPPPPTTTTTTTSPPLTLDQPLLSSSSHQSHTHQPTPPPPPPPGTTSSSSAQPPPSTAAVPLPLAVPASLTAALVPGAAAALEQYKKRDASKVVVRFKAIGNAPIMKNNYFRITAFNRFHAVIQFLRKELNWKPSDSLFLYINSSFSPAPDDSVGNLYRCFGTEGHLIVNYSTQAAWG